MFLVYNAIESLEETLTNLESQTVAGVFDRALLEESVIRILRLKKRIFPEAKILENPEDLVSRMSVRELWAQKMVLPCWYIDNTVHHVQTNVGGIALEGIIDSSPYMEVVKKELQRDLSRIPPLLTNNSPQELANKQSSPNPFFVTERRLLKQIAQELEKAFPQGVPEEVRDYLANLH